MRGASDKVEADRTLLAETREKGRWATLGVYIRLSGPGWLQSAITLGGGSLGGSLYLGVLAGTSLMWLQPTAMVLGVIMLSAIGYVTLSTRKSPFHAINEHVSPVLGWGWALASLVANMVWCLPQYSLANGVLQQNLLPGVVGPDGLLGDIGGKVAVSLVILLITTAVTWSYDTGGWGVRLYEGFLKAIVGVIVVSFFLVVVKLSLAGNLEWGKVLGGFVPNPKAIFTPAPRFEEALAQISASYREYWRELIVDRQRDVLMTAAATAVGINMTFLFPYSLLRRGWGAEFRGLAAFDLGTGMFIPFVLATSCVIMASMTQFHGVPQQGIMSLLEGKAPAADFAPSEKQLREFHDVLEGRVVWELTKERGEAFRGLPEAERSTLVASRSVKPFSEEDTAGVTAERELAAMLVTRDAFDLAKSLKPLTGGFFANVIFGIGVLGMTLSTITLLMLISGFVICEVFGLPRTGWYHRVGTLAAATGALGPFLWDKASFWLVVPTSVFGLMLLPIAYLTFFLLMNQASFLGDSLPRGGRRLWWNVLMACSTLVAGVASVWMIWLKGGIWGIGVAVAFLGAVVAVHIVRRSRNPERRPG